MALSILETPEFQAVLVPDFFTVQESSGGIYSDTNFKFIAVVKDGAGNQLAKMKFPIYPNSTNKGVLSVNRILESQIANFFDISSTTIGTSTSPICEYEVEFGKEYGTPATEYLNEATTTKYTTNSAYTGDVSYEGLHTVRRNIHRDELSWFYWNNATGTTNLGENVLEIKSYNAAGGVLQTCMIRYTATAKTQFKIPIGYNQNSFTSTGDIMSGSVPFVDAAAAYFTIQVGQWDGVSVFTAVSSLFRYDYYDNCSEFDGYTLCWLNDKGGFDSWYFNMFRREKWGIEKKLMKRDTHEFDGNRFSRNTRKHSTSVYHATRTQKATLHSDNITTADSEFIKGLFASPEVYLLDGSDFYPVVVNIPEYEQRYNSIDGVFNQVVEIEYSEPERMA
jgi:hypothetical protein